MRSMGQIASKYAWWILFVSALVVGGRTAYTLVRPTGAFNCCGYGGSNNCRYLDSYRSCATNPDCADAGLYTTCCQLKCNTA